MTVLFLGNLSIKPFEILGVAGFVVFVKCGEASGYIHTCGTVFNTVFTVGAGNCKVLSEKHVCSIDSFLFNHCKGLALGEGFDVICNTGE